MSKRHLESDFACFAAKISSSRKSKYLPEIPMMGSHEEDGLAAVNGIRKCKFNCPTTNGRVKRPRAVALERFDFSRKINESSNTDSSASGVNVKALEGANSTQCSSLTTSLTCVTLPGTSPVAIPASAPTKILPFLFLGSQNDALSKEFIMGNGITHIINASATCPKSPYIADENFLRIPVSDSHTAQLLPFFEKVKNFLDGCRKANGCALVHCLAGISRSPTLVIAYVMSHLELSQEDAYSYVKVRRSSISPNFNFLGQLMEFESILQRPLTPPSALPASNNYSVAFPTMSNRKPDRVMAFNGWMSSATNPSSVNFAQSPTSALAELRFDISSTLNDNKMKQNSTSMTASCAESEDFTLEKRLKSHRSGLAAVQCVSRRSKTCLTDSNFTDAVPPSTTHTAVLNQQNEKLPSASPGKISNSGLFFGKFRKDEMAESCLDAKRPSPPIRPNSIAISSFQFDFDLLKTADIPSQFKNVLLSEVALCKTSPIDAYRVLSCMTDSCHNLPIGCSRDLLQQVESACRSRSFNDIPTLAANGALDGDPCPMRLKDANSFSGACPSSGWNAALEGNVSNASLSSVSSHGSLHGSREVIQVS